MYRLQNSNKSKSMAFLSFHLRKLFDKLAGANGSDYTVVRWAENTFGGGARIDALALLRWLYRHRLHIEMLLDEDRRIAEANNIRKSG